MTVPWILLGIAAGVAFLIGMVVGACLYAQPRPQRFGFMVEHDDRDR